MSEIDKAVAGVAAQAQAQDQHLKPVYESLRKRGHRITAQREVILQIFRDQPPGSHLSAEELYAKLVDDGSTVSLATTYRTLKLLSTLGLLRELDFAEGHKHYELKQDDVPHRRIICIGCNTTIEFEDHFLEEAGQKIGARYNFEVIDAQFKIFGTCPSCRQASTGTAGEKAEVSPPAMKLADAKEGQGFVVTELIGDDICLQALRFGIDAGTEIYVQKNIAGGPVIICKNQLEIAIGRQIAVAIEVVPRG